MPDNTLTETFGELFKQEIENCLPIPISNLLITMIYYPTGERKIEITGSFSERDLQKWIEAHA